MHTVYQIPKRYFYPPVFLFEHHQEDNSISTKGYEIFKINPKYPLVLIVQFIAVKKSKMKIFLLR